MADKYAMVELVSGSVRVDFGQIYAVAFGASFAAHLTTGRGPAEAAEEAERIAKAAVNAIGSLARFKKQNEELILYEGGVL